ncbi:MAG: hypothetical protein PVF73_11345, partial [Bacteroidales bacterium]
SKIAEKNGLYDEGPKKEKTTHIEAKLKKLIKPDNIKFVDSEYNREIALTAYFSVIETHMKDQAYKDFIDDMYYLDDDFNDEQYHFAMASERFRLNMGYIKQEIRKLSALTNKSKVFMRKSYEL